MAESILQPCKCGRSQCGVAAGFTAAYDAAGNRLYERHLHCECRSHLYPEHDSAWLRRADVDAEIGG